LVRKIICDVCGKEIASGTDVYARLFYKVNLLVTTKTGRETIRRVVRSVDLCSVECYKKFNIEAESTVQPVQQASTPASSAYSCDACGKTFDSEFKLKLHKSMSHKSSG
jgi:hypothetical protein